MRQCGAGSPAIPPERHPAYDGSITAYFFERSALPEDFERSELCGDLPDVSMVAHAGASAAAILAVPVGCKGTGRCEQCGQLNAPFGLQAD